MSTPSDEPEGEVVVIEASAGEEDGPVSALVEAVLEAQQEREARERAEAADIAEQRIFGVVIGTIERITERGPVVRYRGCPSPDGLVARSAALIGEADLGRRVALMFESGDPGLPIVTGLLHYDDDRPEHPAMGSLELHEDADAIEINVGKTIRLVVGEASLTITPEGKIVLRGKYLLSRASETHRIQGGTVRIN